MARWELHRYSHVYPSVASGPSLFIKALGTTALAEGPCLAAQESFAFTSSSQNEQAAAHSCCWDMDAKFSLSAMLATSATHAVPPSLRRRGCKKCKNTFTVSTHLPYKSTHVTIMMGCKRSALRMFQHRQLPLF